MHRDPKSKLDIFSLDTDVFVFPVGHYPMFPKSTTLLRIKGERISILESYMGLGHKKAETLIGWYAFKGTDSAGSFCWEGCIKAFQSIFAS